MPVIKKPLVQFWAKSPRDSEPTWSNVHTVLAHLIDVALLAQALIKHSSPQLRESLASLLPELQQGEALRLIAAWAGTHDVGKISPGFQSKIPRLAEDLRRSGLSFPHSAEKNHGLVSFDFLLRWLENRYNVPRVYAAPLANAIAGHHGRLFAAQLLIAGGKEKWEQSRTQHAEFVLTALGVDHVKNFAVAPPTPAFATVLAGLVCVADWIGSNERWFPFRPLEIAEIDEYFIQRRLAAERAVGELHFGRRPLAAQTHISFERLFPFPLNKTQSTVVDLARKAAAPFIIVVESPTGAGKTEASLAVYATMARKSAMGLYYALPTRTTGNQMFGRVHGFLDKLFTGEQTELHLLHSETDLHPGYQELRLQSIAGEDGESALRATAWFTGRKRGLLAEHAVGTIDQAMLAAMQVKHFFVRLFGLSDKLVVLDEVHAYDTYMSTIMDTLIGWLRAAGSSIILLSATLPQKRRNELLGAFGVDFSKGSTMPYPSVTLVDSEGLFQSLTISEVDSRAIRLEIKTYEPLTKIDTFVALLTELVLGGGCIGCIMNTVGEAQDIFEKLRSLMPAEKVHLFHGRFTRRDRRSIEDHWVKALGKPDNLRLNPDRPSGHVFIATQVVEQSLDIDFDAMITDLAPVDLVLQRAGRLQRHMRTARPEEHRSPRLFVLMPEIKEDLSFGLSRYVYSPLILVRSAMALVRHHDVIAVPQDVSPLIEEVYGEVPVEPPAELTETVEGWRTTLEGGTYAERFEALAQGLPRVDECEDAFGFTVGLSQLEDPEVHSHTRLGRDSITVILLDESEAENLRVGNDRGKLFVDRSVSVSRVQWYKHFVEQEPPDEWRQHPFLRWCRPAAMSNGLYRASCGEFSYDYYLGLRYGVGSPAPE